MQIVIAGAGSVGRSIARELISHGHEVTLVDRSTEAMRIASVPQADWQLADAASHAETGLKSAEVEALEALPSAQLREALDSLSEEHRMVVLMADVEGMSYKEIAEELGVPMGTVMSRLNRARKNLRSALADVAAEYGIGGAK